ncbi:hypothetical protein, partial [Aneurinibacillus aneurinilyticus]|uniref:hypothetical protein n=1 Tax=Aneurinibacillus aneurinilyticus TaxID=1391 RepID=UPI003523F34F
AQQGKATNNIKCDHSFAFRNWGYFHTELSSPIPLIYFYKLLSSLFYVALIEEMASNREILSLP